MATYGSFPGVRVNTSSGSVASVAIGEEEKLVLFGETDYAYDTSNDEIIVEGDDASLSVSAESPEQIAAPREAEKKFGTDSELSQGMKEALQNGANIDFLYGVPVGRDFVENETQSNQSGTLANFPVVENTGTATDSGGQNLNDMGVDVSDTGGGTLDVQFRYDGAPSVPSDSDTVFINPLTGEYNADASPSGDYEFSYTYSQWGNAIQSQETRNVVNENETAVYMALEESDSVSSTLQTEVSSLRNDYQLVTGWCVAEPNDNEVLSSVTNTNGGADPRYNTSNYSSANQSISEDYFFKFAPGREDDADVKTIAGGVGGKFAGNDISDPVYNEQLSGYSGLEQSFSKSHADNMRGEDIIPIRSGGSVRIKGNRSTNFSSSDSVGSTFHTRRITDRVILIGKQVGDDIIGRINDEDTRRAAERAISAEMRSLVDDRLIKGNDGDGQEWRVDVYPDSTNDNEVNIDIAFSPYGVVKRVDESITVNTN